MNYAMEGFSVRKAVLEDAEGIAAITKSAFVAYAKLAGLETVAALKEDMETVIKDIESKIVFVALLDGKVVGSVRIELQGDTAYFSRFGVSTEYQNLGIGKSLMNIVDVEMKYRKIKQLQLHTASKVSSLVRFYYSRGFYVDSTTKDRGYVRAFMVKDYQ